MIKELIYHQSKDTNIYPNWFKSLLLEIQDLNKIKETKIFLSSHHILNNIQLKNFMNI